MLVGHNPGMHELALALDRQRRRARRARRSPTICRPSGLAIFDFAIDDWNDVAFRRGTTGAVHQPETVEAGFGRLSAADIACRHV